MRLEKLPYLVNLLEQYGTPSSEVRQFVLDALERWGIGEDIIKGYLGQHRVPPKHDVSVIVAWDMRYELQGRAVTAIRQRLSEAGRDVVILDCNSNPATRRYYFQTLIPSLRPIALVLSMCVSGMSELDSHTHYLERLGFPIVYLQERPRVLHSNSAYVGWSNFDLGYAAGKLAAERGTRDVTLMYYEGFESHLARKAGFLKGLSENCPHNVATNCISSPIMGDPFEDKYFQAHIRQTYLRMLVKKSCANTVFAPSAVVALALLQAAEDEFGASIPAFSIIAIGCEAWMRAWQRASRSPTLDVIGIPLEAAGRIAAETLLKLVAGAEVATVEREVIVSGTEASSAHEAARFHREFLGFTHAVSSARYDGS